MTLREQVGDALAEAEDAVGSASPRSVFDRQVDAVLVVIAERERLLRERIEALPEYVFAEPFGVRLDKANVLGVFDDES